MTIFVGVEALTVKADRAATEKEEGESAGLEPKKALALFVVVATGATEEAVGATLVVVWLTSIRVILLWADPMGDWQRVGTTREKASTAQEKVVTQRKDS